MIKIAFSTDGAAWEDDPERNASYIADQIKARMSLLCPGGSLSLFDFYGSRIGSMEKTGEKNK